MSTNFLVSTGVNFHWWRMRIAECGFNVTCMCCMFTCWSTSQSACSDLRPDGAKCSHLSLLYWALLPSTRNSSLKGINISQHDWRTIDPFCLKHFLLLSLVKTEKMFVLFLPQIFWYSSPTTITHDGTNVNTCFTMKISMLNFVTDYFLSLSLKKMLKKIAKKGGENDLVLAKPGLDYCL